MFAASLAVCAYYYIVVWDRAPMAGGGGQPDGFLPGGRGKRGPLFGLFAAHHSLLARERVKNRLARLIPAHLIRSVYVWTASLLLIGVCIGWRPVGGEIYRVAGWRAVVHLAVQLAGVWIIARSVGAIDPLELAGIRRAARHEALQITARIDGCGTRCISGGCWPRSAHRT